MLPQTSVLRVLAADDEITVQRALDRMLRAQGHTVMTVDSGEAALASVSAYRPDVILLDVQMQGIDGLETLARLRQQAPAVPVIIMTGQGDVDTAVRAFKRGAVDFVVKPFMEAKLLGAINAVEDARREPPSSPYSNLAPTMIGESPRFREALGLAMQFARPEINILLDGETGTGKELFARTIHAASKRGRGPFVPVDCSMLAESLIESELFGHEKGAFTGATGTRVGHFERADGGTLFLDELGNLSLSVQAKLLRVLQERTLQRVGGREPRQLDVRVVAATNIDLRGAVARGAFRMDLYYRLAEATICPPPLRERREDVRPLAEHFVERYAARFDVEVRGISAEAFARLEAYDWPGNIRELENVMKSAVVLAKDIVGPEHIPARISNPASAISLAGGSAPASAPPGSAAAKDVLMGGAAGMGAPFAGAGQASASLAGAPDEANGAAPPSGRERARFRMEIEFGTEADGMDLKALASAAIEKAERTVLEAILKQRNYSQAELAKLMNIDPKTLRAKLRKYGLDGSSSS